MHTVRLTWRMLVLITVGGLGTLSVCEGAQAPSSLYGVFIGTTEADESIRRSLNLVSDPEPEVIRWRIALYRDGKTLAPTRYELRCDYGLTAQGEPGLARNIKTVERQGVWTIRRTNRDPDTAILDLNGALSLVQIDDNIVHVLHPERGLMTGAGWSYSLNRADRAEEVVDPALVRSAPDMSYQIAPAATGPDVFGVFEGRTPCKGIARALDIAVHPGCLKAKWRITLYQDPRTQAPTRYRVEGTLLRRGAAEGTWTRIRRENDPRSTVYRVTRAGNNRPIHLLEGKDNVLFFLNQEHQLLVGNIYFSYTLGRRAVR